MPPKTSLKVQCLDKEYDCSQLIVVGRAKDCTITLDDGMVSTKHAIIQDDYVMDLGSTNGTVVNKQNIKPHQKKFLKHGDIIMFGETKCKVRNNTGADAPGGKSGGKGNQDAQQVMMQSKRFGNRRASEHRAQTPAEQKQQASKIKEQMEKEFESIIGHDNIKKQLQTFHKKVQLDRIREANGKGADTKRLYHMIFQGPPGTGKTTMANLVARLMRDMKIIETDNVVFVNNALDLLAGFAGQTPGKVDAKVEEAKGGVLFIDEAYSIVKSKEREKDSFGKEAIETIMKHLDPPTCVFIFAGYEKEMEEFLQVNPGLARRIPYRYDFHAYSNEQLTEICLKMCEGAGENVQNDFGPKFHELLNGLGEKLIAKQNAGLVNNWVSFAQMTRDDRIDLDEAKRNPKIASMLDAKDFLDCIDKIKNMSIEN